MGKLIGCGSPWGEKPVEFSRVPGTTRLYYREIWFFSGGFEKWVLDDDPPKLSGDHLLEEITEAEARQLMESTGHKWVDPRGPDNSVTYEEFERLIAARVAKSRRGPQATE